MSHYTQCSLHPEPQDLNYYLLPEVWVSRTGASGTLRARAGPPEDGGTLRGWQDPQRMAGPPEAGMAR